jgi:hypothetical protein
MYLFNPPLYLSLAAFKAQGNDYDLTPYSDAQLTDLLVRASAKADSIMHRSYQPQEISERFYGDGSNSLIIDRAPLAYVKQIQFVQPGMVGFNIPVSQILIDYRTSEALQYTPLTFIGQGYTTTFPRGTPVDILYAFGYGVAIASPAFTLADLPVGTSNTHLAPGAYYIGISTKTMWGESIPTIVGPYTTASGVIQASLVAQPGAYLYNVYIGTTALNGQLVGQTPATTYGNTALSATVSSQTPSPYLFTQALPLVDTSANPLPGAIIEATRIMTLGILWEQNNLANRGIYKQDSGRKSLMWKSTDGMSGKGLSYAEGQATELLRPYALNAIF